MQSTGLVRRALSDTVGLATLAVLVAFLAYIVPSGETPDQIRNMFPLVYGVLAIPGYVCWIRIDNLKQQPHWILQALVSVAAGVVSFVLDTLVGFLWHPSLPILHAATSTGIMLGITALICPGYTLIAISGWVRSVSLRSRVLYF